MDDVRERKLKPFTFKNIAPCLLVHDIQKTTQFYKNFLHFNILRADKEFGHVARDGIHIEFRKSDRMSVDGCCEYNERRNLEIIVDNLDQLHTELMLSNVHILWGAAEVADNKRKFEIEDCNGYVLMFTEYLDYKVF